MSQEYQILSMVEKIKLLKLTATELKEISGGIQAIDKNADRMLACIRLLELDITDVAGILYGLESEEAPDKSRQQAVV